MLELERNVEIDFLDFTLEDLAKYLKNENFFEERDLYLVDILSKNEIVFQVYSNKMFGTQLQFFKYYETEKKLKVKSRYKYKLLPGFYVILIGLFSFIFQVQLDYENWIKYLIAIILVVIFGFVFGFMNLRHDSKEIERELIIRLKDLMRKKGYRVSL